MRQFRKDCRSRRGYRTHGWGRVGGHRNYGRKGGRGAMAGRFKHLKTYMYVQKAQGWPDPDWKPGKDGFQRPAKILRVEHVNVVNVKDIDLKADKWVEKGLAEKKGSTYIVDLAKLNVQKLLGSGTISKHVEVTVDRAVPKAVEKIQVAGGKVTALTTGENSDD